jgi:hypothetical protein
MMYRSSAYLVLLFMVRGNACGIHLKSLIMADNPAGTDRTGDQATLSGHDWNTHSEGHKLTLIMPPLSDTHRVPEEKAAQPTPGDGRF